MPKWLISIGRIFYAIGLIGIGVQHFIFQHLIAVIAPPWSSSAPGHPLRAFLVGAALIAAGLAIIFNIKARTVAAITGVALLILVAIDDIPNQLANSPQYLGSWTNTFKALTLCGGAWLVAGSLPEPPSTRQHLLEKLMPIGRFFLPITAIVFGIDHFLYTPFVATLVPAWIPGHIFWTYFAGIALIAAGAAMIVKFSPLKILPQLAALMLGIMIFLWLLMLHIPRAIADPHSGLGNEWTSVCEALAFSGIAFIQAALPASSRFSISSSK